MTAGEYVFCFYRIVTKGHENYHHVLIPGQSDQGLHHLQGDSYQYILTTSKVVSLTNGDLSSEFIRCLIMDGESLLKRFKKANKNKR